jgi:hypothetical protein
MTRKAQELLFLLLHVRNCAICVQAQLTGVEIESGNHPCIHRKHTDWAIIFSFTQLN